MKAVRIYKDNIREHILKSLFFTETTLFTFGALTLAGILYVVTKYVIHYFDWGSFISALVIGEIIYIAFATQKIDNLPIYMLVPRAIHHAFQNKKLRDKQIDPYFTDFSIQDNLIFRNKSIIRIYRVEPFDIALLNDQDREHFFVKLKQLIHVLPAQVQFIVRKEQATASDYSNHFFSLYNDSEPKREPFISSYIHDLTELLHKHTIFTVRHYAVFSVSADTKKTQSKVNAIKKLNDMGLRFASALQACNIQVQPILNEELVRFTQSILR